MLSLTPVDPKAETTLAFKRFQYLCCFGVVSLPQNDYYGGVPKGKPKAYGKWFSPVLQKFTCIIVNRGYVIRIHSMP